MINNNKRYLDLQQYNTWFDYFKSLIDYKLRDQKKKNIVFISDCDGTLTDGRSYFKDKKEMKSYCSYDKEAVKFIIDYMRDEIIFVSGDKEGFNITKNRIKNFFDSCKFNGPSCLNINSQERTELVLKLKKQGNIVVFIGDALSDIPAMSSANYSLTVHNAPQEVWKYCDYISSIEGGHGGFSDCIFNFYEKILP